MDPTGLKLALGLQMVPEHFGGEVVYLDWRCLALLLAENAVGILPLGYLQNVATQEILVFEHNTLGSFVGTHDFQSL